MNYKLLRIDLISIMVFVTAQEIEKSEAAPDLTCATKSSTISLVLVALRKTHFSAFL